jgi:hypothetical protein
MPFNQGQLKEVRSTSAPADRGLRPGDNAARNGSVGHSAAAAFLGSLILAVRGFRTEGLKLLDVAGRVTFGVLTVKSMNGVKRGSHARTRAKGRPQRRHSALFDLGPPLCGPLPTKGADMVRCLFERDRCRR